MVCPLPALGARRLDLYNALRRSRNEREGRADNVQASAEALLAWPIARGRLSFPPCRWVTPLLDQHENQLPFYASKQVAGLGGFPYEAPYQPRHFYDGWSGRHRALTLW